MERLFNMIPISYHFQVADEVVLDKIDPKQPKTTSSATWKWLGQLLQAPRYGQIEITCQITHRIWAILKVLPNHFQVADEVVLD